MTINQTPQAPPTDQAAAPPALPPFNLPPKKRRPVKWIVLAVAVLGIAFFIHSYREAAKARQEAASTVSYEEYTISPQDITVTLSGSAPLNAANSYVVTTLISGEVLSAPFEEGDTVAKDDILYIIDAADAAATVERAELTLSQSRQSYNSRLESLKNLQIHADEAGTLVSLLVKEGDTVVPGQAVAQIRNSNVMALELPFGANDVSQLYVGQAAQVSLEGSFETLSGTVAEISRVDRVLPGNMLVRTVTLHVNNPGGIAPGQVATAMIGSIACNGSGTFTYQDEYTLTAALSGDVAKTAYKEGDWVAAGALLLTLKSSALDLEMEGAAISLRDAELNLESQQRRLESYTIKSPIAGTIIEKNYKEGDTLESGKPLCTIFDLSYLTQTLNIHELDISMVEVGQRVSVVTDAVKHREYQGVVTKVNINGTTYSGVTSYPVTIQLEGDTTGLLPGLNADATITIARHQGVLAVPNAAVLRGDRIMVYTGNAEASQQDPKLPPGFEYREVTLGGADDSFIQVLDGLSEGDRVAIIDAAKDEEYIQTPFGPVPASQMNPSN